MINRTSILLISILLCITAHNAAGRERTKTKTTEGFSPYTALHLLSRKTLAEICDPQIVAKFPNWYPGWAVQTVLESRFLHPTRFNKKLNTDVQNHIDEIQNYLDQLKEEKKTINKYALTFFDVQIKDLLTRTNKLMKVPYTNKYDNSDEIKKLVDTHGVYAEELVHQTSEKDLDTLTIGNIGKAFFDEYYNRDEKDNYEVLTYLNPLTDEIVTALYKIIHVYANVPDSSVYNSLGEIEKSLLEEFYNTFYPLLEPIQLKNVVIKALVGDEDVPEITAHNFFTPALFNFARNPISAFNPIFIRDMFITNFSPLFELEELHEAAQKEFFSFTFLEEFNDALPDKVLNQDFKDPKDKDVRKRAKLYLVFYDVFTFVRYDRKLLPERDQTEKVPILKEMLKWVLTNKYFEPFFLESDGGINNAGQDYQHVISRERWNVYKLPVAYLICSKIPGCKFTELPEYQVLLKQSVDTGFLSSEKAREKAKIFIDVEDLSEMIKDMSGQQIDEIHKQFDEIDLTEEDIFEEEDLEKDEITEEDLEKEIPIISGEKPVIISEKKEHKQKEDEGLEEPIVVKKKAKPTFKAWTGLNKPKTQSGKKEFKKPEEEELIESGLKKDLTGKEAIKQPIKKVEDFEPEEKKIKRRPSLKAPTQISQKHIVKVP